MTVQQTKRQNMTHFQKMNALEFIHFIKSLENGEMKNLKTVMKVDGLAARFGKDANGKIFFESARSGPVFDVGSFSIYTMEKGCDEASLERARHYDNLLLHFQLSGILKELPNDTKVVCEIFYNPMADENSDEIKFVNISYDKNKLGSLMTILPYCVISASTGEKLDDSILNFLYENSNDEVKIICPNLEMGVIDLSQYIQPIMELDDIAKKVIISRKHADKEMKAHFLDIIQNVKEKVADYILHHEAVFDKYKLGPNIEGIVLWINTREYKIITKEFKEILNAK